jgi:uncharacterized membrane protein YphA (DoxX/SURF4 family)
MKKFFFDCGTRDSTASLGILALRVMIGLMILIGHGIPKIRNYAILKDGFHVPDLFPLYYISRPMSLTACIAAEVGAACLIMIGFATRPAAFFLGFVMVVAAFNYLGATPWFNTTATLVETKEMSVLYLITMIGIILTGAGSYSLDSTLYRESKRRRW